MLLIILIAIPLIGALILLFTQDKSIKIPFAISLTILLLGIFGLKGVLGGCVCNGKA